MKDEILYDLNRAKNALRSAKRNFQEGDIYTAANRIFVACENAIFVRMKLKYGNTTISRKRIIQKINAIDPDLKDIYEASYDIRVQADYGKRSRITELNKASIEGIITRVEKIITDTETELTAYQQVNPPKPR